MKGDEEEQEYVIRQVGVNDKKEFEGFYENPQNIREEIKTIN